MAKGRGQRQCVYKIAFIKAVLRPQRPVQFKHKVLNVISTRGFVVFLFKSYVPTLKCCEVQRVSIILTLLFSKYIWSNLVKQMLGIQYNERYFSILRYTNRL